MTVPVVRQTAPWPLRRNAPANFDQMADAVGASLPNTIDDMNVVVPFVNDRAIAADASAQAAAASAGAAAAKAGEAAQSANAAQAYAASLEALDELWLGAAASDPATGKAGAPLVAGNAYVNSATGYLRAFNGTEWVQGVSAVSGVNSVNGQTGAVDLTAQMHATALLF